jgi:hypothetical protein
MATVHELIPLVPGELGLSGRLKPEYIDQYGQTAFDGNMLVVLAAKQYVDATGDTGFWQQHRAQLVEVLGYYRSHVKNSLLQQPPYSDWQDSVKREGATFYTNMLYAHVLEQVAGDPAFPDAAAQARALRARVDEAFKDPRTGLYRSMETGPQVSLDGNLLALDLGCVKADSPEGRALYGALKQSPLWQASEGPGFTTWPPYPDTQKSPMQKLIGLGGYHDTLSWSWQVALAAKVAGQLGDVAQARRILGRLEAVARRDGTIAEVYAPRPGLPVEKTPLYRSEMPFSWGAAFVIDAVTALGDVRLASRPNGLVR